MLVKTIRCHGRIFEDRKNLKNSDARNSMQWFRHRSIATIGLSSCNLCRYIVLKLRYPISLSKIVSTSSTWSCTVPLSEDNKCLSKNSQSFWEKKNCTVM